MAEWRDAAHMPVARLEGCSFAADPDLTASPKLGWLAGLVVRARAQGRLPRVEEVSPRLIGPAALPTVMILDVEGPPRRFRIRLVGTDLSRMAGRDSTGRLFDELSDRQGAANAFYLRQMDHIADSGDCVVVTADLYYRRNDWQHFRSIWAPLAGPQGDIERIACAVEAPKQLRARRSLI
ncbi:PAS domain-containing protein [Marinibaculum pumilum]|uniref:PAS domain-containing protein n=1 Tax=Marinibaculum pumilum TaxID=1766165 RepID=A0ABV7L9U3_9PROT